MSKYTFNFNNFSLNVLPPNKRLDKFTAFARSLMSPLTWLHSNFFAKFYEGDYSANYSNSTTYNFGDTVKDTDKSIYYCLQTCTGINPLNSDYWLKVNDFFIGIKDQLKITSQIALFEYYLNTIFERSYYYTPSQYPLTSSYHNDIYITTNDINASLFLVAIKDEDSSVVSLRDYDADYFVGTNPTDYNQNAFTINVNINVADDLGLSFPELEPQVRFYADKMNLAGLKYNIQSYI